MNMAFETTYYFCPDMFEPATEGANIDSYEAYTKALSAGKSKISEANKLIQAGKHDAAVKALQEAKQDFSDGIDAIHKIPDGILSATIIQKIAKQTVGISQMFKQSKELAKMSKGIDDPNKDWSYALNVLGVGKVMNWIIPGANAGYDVQRRHINTEQEKTRGQKKKFTFNGFKEDLIFVLNSYIDAVEGMIKNVRNQKLYKTRDKLIQESYIEDLV